MSRVIYAAPYTSIIDQNADTFEKIFGTENVIEHHSSAEYLFFRKPEPRRIPQNAGRRKLGRPRHRHDHRAAV